MFFRLLAVFTVIPFVELILLIEIGKRIGTLSTIGLILLTGILGAGLARMQGFQVLYRIRQELASGNLPGDSLLDALLILVGGLLLLTPGFLTDTLGFLLLFPATRTFFREALKKAFRSKLSHQEMTFIRSFQDEDRSFS